MIERTVRIYNRPTTKQDLMNYCNKHIFTSGLHTDTYIPAIPVKFTTIMDTYENNEHIRTYYVEDLWDIINNLKEEYENVEKKTESNL